MFDDRPKIFFTGLASGLFEGQSITSGTSLDKNCWATVLLQSPSSTELLFRITDEMVLKNLNVVGAIHNCIERMIAHQALDTDPSPCHNLRFILWNSFDFSFGIF